MKKTKIICTIGPASANSETLKKMILAGMNVARINMSHGTFEGHQKTIDLVKSIRKKMNLPVALMMDTKGPEMRIKTFEHGSIILKEKQTFTFTSNEVIGNEKVVSLAYKPLVKQVKVGDKIFANNGMLVLKVKEITNTDIVCVVLYGGKLSDRKGINVPKIKPNGPYLSEQDKLDLAFAIKNDAEYIAASFVCNANDVIELREYLDSLGGNDIKIIAKIENLEGVKNREKIAQIADGIMVARGDLGVEVPLESLPEIQKRTIKICKKYGKISVVATEMLESMTTSIRPTRAEVSDVANAIYDMTSATMLSGETAVGINPVAVVKTMAKIAKEAEINISYNKRYYNLPVESLCVSDSVADSTCKNSISLNAKLIVAYTNTGSTASYLSRYMVKTPILALTQSEKMFNALALYWNITPALQTKINTESEMIEIAEKKAKELKLATSGDIIIVTTGIPNQTGQTDMMKVVKVK